MTTNQTIDGVPRKALADFIEYSVPGPYDQREKWEADKAELRALLDAPACKMCGDSGWVPEPFSIRENVLECPECKPAAQPQGEPVACVIAFREGAKEPEILSWNQLSVGEHRLYAEQLAPDIKLHVNVSNVKVTLNADGSYSIDQGDRPVEYKLHMGDALKVFEALKVHRISRNVEQEDLGPMGATEIETWSTAIGVTLEMHTAMGGCTLIVTASTK